MTERVKSWLREVEYYVAGMPMVRTSDGYLAPWNREAIVKQLLRETKLAEEFFGIPAMTRAEAEEIAREAETRILSMKAKFVSAPLIREIVNNILLEKSEERPNYAVYRNVLTRVGVPVYDAYLIDVGEGFEAKENANLQPNPETSHKKKGDKVSKEEYLLLMHPRLADAHLKGDLHIHDLEYFGTRPFCQDWDLRYFFYYGLMPDGMGLKSSVAGPAKHAEVALLHSVKALASAQTNFAGGQGFYNYTVFMAPYLRGLSYKQVKQLAQMMFFELTQIYVARGGQMVFSNIQITPGVPELWKDKPVVYMGKVGPDVYGDYEDEVRMFFRAIYEVAFEGDWWGKPFNFPKLEGGITPEFFKSEYDEDWLLAHKVVSKFGTPYFDNMLPAYRGYGKGVSCYQCLLPEAELVVKASNPRVVKVSELLGSSPLIEEPNIEALTPEGFAKPKALVKKPYKGEIVKVKLKYGLEFEATANHPCLVRRRHVVKQGEGRYRTVYEELVVEARELSPNTDYLPIHLGWARHLPDSVTIDLLKEFSEAGVKVKVDGDLLSAYPRSNTIKRFVEVDEKLGFIVGSYLGEGDANQDNYMVRWSFSLDEEHLAVKVSELLRQVFNVDPHIHRQATAYVVSVPNKALYELFVKVWKLGSRSEDKKLPRKLLVASSRFLKGLVEGVIASEGNFYSKRLSNGSSHRYLRIRMVSKAVEDIAIAIRALGAMAKLYWHRYGRGDRRVGQVTVSGKDLLQLEEALTTGLLKEEVRWVKVKGVAKKSYEGDVYDLVDVGRGHVFTLLNGVVTHNCCAYTFTETPETDPEFNAKLYFEDGKHFSMGGMQVVTLNLPRIAYRARGDDDRLFEEARRLMDLAVEIFKVKKRWMDLAVKAGRLPFAVQRPRDPRTGRRGPPAVDLDSLVYTIGVVGGNEMAQWHTGYQLHESPEAVKLLVKLLLEMRKYKVELEQRTGLRLAIARTPAESCAQRLAVADLISPEFRDMAVKVVKGDLERAKELLAEGVRDVPVYYTNGTHVYVGAQIPLTERISIEQKFWPILSGGNIFHIWLGEAYPDPEALFKLTKRIATQTQIGYFAYTKDLTICQQCFEVSAGINDVCPSCGSPNVKYWSRVTGYYQEVSGWNEAKKQELKERYRTRISV